ncbi:hypothetical protein BUALT_Bualt04G0068600 [Buddleja alternifolia]|uniref:DUF4216 domain-containing protein n=1 Tax=Buddleja alternifolia TaxID=168488 RepID=A0AAV6XN91_9LAMI|nr:hypothetical protein BUALT_Bualt04G0068600 [Buddleja alternifolia]
MNLMSEPIIFESTTQDNHDPFIEMVIDAASPKFDWNTRNEPERPNPTAEKFFNLKDAADSPLWSGCEDYSELSALSELLNIKSESNLSERHFNRFLKAFGQMLPKGHKLPDSFYSSKKVVAPLGLGVEKIDACENDCMLYSKDDNKLQRLYTSAEHMRWHKESLGEEGKLLHPRDGEAWKHFDCTHPTFVAETRNVRLACSTDGFSPHNQTSRPYSCWPVIVTPYNLPPWMCMDHPYMFLTLLVPGPRSPGKSLVVYLQPLIDELKTLWNDGVETYDVSKAQNFQMRAALMWTVSDFSAYGMLSGWSTHDHPYRYQKDNFTKGRIETDSSIIRLTGEELEVAVASLPNIEPPKICKRRDLELKEVNGKYIKPKASYTLTKEERLKVLKWIKNLRRNNVNARLDLQKFEERLKVLKWIKNLRLPDGQNKARVEGSIVEAYLIEETSTFCSHFFAPEVETRSRTVGRNDNVNQAEYSSRLSVFKSIGRPFSPKNPTRTLSPPEKAASTIYILLNCPEISEYVELYDAEKQAQIPNLTYKALGVMHNKEFATWFCNYVQNPSNQITNKDIKQFSRGFSSIVKRWNGYFVNGYRFHTLEYGETRSTMNSGVCINGSYYDDSSIDYYGELLEILELSFFGSGNTVILFKCKWFDTGKHGTKVHSRYKFVDVNYNRTMAEDNPFVLASQCHQVYFVPCPWRKKATDRNWRAVFKVKARSTYEISQTAVHNQQTPLEDFFQETNSDPARIILDNELDDVAILTDVNRQEEEVNPVELQPSRREFEEEFESDELEVGSIDFSEEELEDEESENENNLTSDDITMSATRGGKSKRPFVVHSHEVDQGHVSFTSMMTAKMNHLGDLELGLNNDVDGEQELVDDVAEDVDEEEVEEERHTSEHTSEQHVEANLGIKDKIERDDKGREILVIQEKCFISVAAPRSMLGDMRGWFTKPWPTFNKIPGDVKRNLFGKFKDKFTWHDPWTEAQVYKIWKSYCSRSFSAEMMRLRKKSRSATPPDYMRSDILEDLWDIWESPKFKKLQENNRKNRVSDRDGMGVALSSAGTISIAHHAQRMVAQNGGKPVPHELVFNRCHKRNKGLGPFVDEKSKRTSTYTKLKESHSQSCGDAVLSPQGSSTFIPEAWAKASGGAKNGRCYGFGKSYSDNFTSFGTIPSNNSSQAEVDQLKERMQELEKEQQEIKANLSELLALTRATHANLSGQHFFPGQYSTASPADQQRNGALVHFDADTAT